MKSTAGFAFFLLFLGGFALVQLRNMGEEAQANLPTVETISASAWRPSHLGEMRLTDDTPLYLQFETTGEVNGHAGCNRFFGSYVLDEGGAIAIESIGMTRMACPTEVMSIEMTFIEALQGAARVALADQRMALRNPDGGTLVRFDAVPRSE